MAATWSRHGSTAAIPCRAQASTASSRFHCSRIVARLMDRREVRIIKFGSNAVLFLTHALSNSMHGKQLAHAGGGQIGVMQYTRFVGQAEQVGEMQQRTCALLSADQDEMVLQSV
jgi:hypothetical protein